MFIITFDFISIQSGFDSGQFDYVDVFTRERTYRCIFSKSLDGHESEVGHDCKMTSGPETTTSTTTTTTTTTTTSTTITTFTTPTSTTSTTTISTTPDDPSFYNGCNEMILNACEINDCPKQAVYGIENVNVCQLTCLVSPDICQSWVYLNKEKVKAKAWEISLCTRYFFIIRFVNYTHASCQNG